MSNTDIIRAWKDNEFRASLGEQQIPENPAGQIELPDELLGKVQGGSNPSAFGNCLSVTFLPVSCCGYGPIQPVPVQPVNPYE